MTSHDIKVRRLPDQTIVWCKTDNVVLFTQYGGRDDVPFAELLEAVADHRGRPATVGRARLVRNPDGTYRFDMEDVDLSAAVAADDFTVHQVEGAPTRVTLTVSVDRIDFDLADVQIDEAYLFGDETTTTYRLHPVRGARR